jgi:hypothetical protein
MDSCYAEKSWQFGGRSTGDKLYENLINNTFLINHTTIRLSRGRYQRKNDKNSAHEARFEPIRAESK